MKEINPEQIYKLDYAGYPITVGISAGIWLSVYNVCEALSSDIREYVDDKIVWVKVNGEPWEVIRSVDLFHACNESLQNHPSALSLHNWLGSTLHEDLDAAVREKQRKEEEALIKFRKEERKIERISSDCRINTYHYQDKPIRWIMHDFRPLIFVEDECNAIGIPFDSEKVEARKDKGECYLFSNDEVKDVLVIGKGGAHSLGMSDPLPGKPFNKWLNQSFPRQEDALQRRIAILERENKELRLKAGGTL